VPTGTEPGVYLLASLGGNGRVGALDGRYPEAGRVAVERIRKVLVKNGRLFIDGGPLKEVPLGIP
jgi:hypothetical protein